MKTIFL